MIADRYHEENLGSPRQVRNTLAYVLNNVRKHVLEEMAQTCEWNWLDPCSSAEYFDGWKHVDPVPIDKYAPVRGAAHLVAQETVAQTSAHRHQRNPRARLFCQIGGPVRAAAQSLARRSNATADGAGATRTRLATPAPAQTVAAELPPRQLSAQAPTLALPSQPRSDKPPYKLRRSRPGAASGL